MTVTIDYGNLATLASVTATPFDNWTGGAGTSDGFYRVQLDGTTTVIPAQNWTNGVVRTGDRVICVQVGKQIYIIGSVANQALKMTLAEITYVAVDNTDNTQSLILCQTDDGFSGLQCKMAVPMGVVVGTRVFGIVDSGTIFYVLGVVTSNYNAGVPQTNIACLTADWNTTITSGLYQGAPGTANAPTAGVWYMGEVHVHSSAYITQTLNEFVSANNVRRVWERAKIGGIWQPWRIAYGSDVPLTQMASAGSGSSFSAGVSSYGGGYPIVSYQKQGGICNLRGLCQANAAIANGATIMTIPAAMLPLFQSGETLQFIGHSLSSAGGVPMRFGINTSGQISYNPVTGANLAAGQNFALDCTWIAGT